MINHLFTILAQAPQGAPGQPTSALPQILMILSMVAIFYFLILGPQRKQAKEKAAMIGAVKNGDKVIMTSGIHGIVANVKEATVVVKVADNVKMEFDKSAIATILKSSNGDQSKPE